MCRLQNIARGDYRADEWTDGQTLDKVIPMCRYAPQATLRRRHKNSVSVKVFSI